MTQELSRDVGASDWILPSLLLTSQVSSSVSIIHSFSPPSFLLLLSTS
jgi:hypothetical protein